MHTVHECDSVSPRCHARTPSVQRGVGGGGGVAICCCVPQHSARRQRDPPQEATSRALTCSNSPSRMFTPARRSPKENSYAFVQPWVAMVGVGTTTTTHKVATKHPSRTVNERRLFGRPFGPGECTMALERHAGRTETCDTQGLLGQKEVCLRGGCRHCGWVGDPLACGT
jgi:hypothetical protein